LIPDQPCHELDSPTPGWRIGQQTDDIKAFVVALRHDSHVDHNKIGVVGGSAGATHAVWVALDTTDSGVGVWPFWNADARPQCAVMLSASYDFSDLTPPPGHTQFPEMALKYTQNYAQTADLATLKDLSPVSLVKTPEEAPFRPLFMINSWLDNPTPYHQIVDMICALKAKGVPDGAYQTLTIPDSHEHGFAYWDSPDGVPIGPTKLIKGDVISFLDARLK
jgi:acetyl esterase/lipase